MTPQGTGAMGQKLDAEEVSRPKIRRGGTWWRLACCVSNKCHECMTQWFMEKTRFVCKCTHIYLEMIMKYRGFFCCMFFVLFWLTSVESCKFCIIVSWSGWIPRQSATKGLYKIGGFVVYCDGRVLYSYVLQISSKSGWSKSGSKRLYKCLVVLDWLLLLAWDLYGESVAVAMKYYTEH